MFSRRCVLTGARRMSGTVFPMSDKNPPTPVQSIGLKDKKKRIGLVGTKIERGSPSYLIFKELLVIDENGVNKGRIRIGDALNMVDTARFDLQIMNDDLKNPVARIMPRVICDTKPSGTLKDSIDSSTKSYITAPPKPKPPKQKELEISNQTTLHDLNTKTAKLCEFLNKGLSVSVNVVAKPVKMTVVATEKFDIRKVIEESVLGMGVLGSSRLDRKTLKMVFNPKKSK